jgi:hypothetical protein
MNTEPKKREELGKEMAEKNEKELISPTVQNAHAAGDGALGRSEESVLDKEIDKADAKSSGETNVY